MREFFENLVAGIFIGLIISSPIWVMSFVRYFNQAESIVYVDGKVVYEGPNHFVTVNSSHYNSTKEVKIYKDVYKLYLEARYFSDNVKMESK